MKLEFLPVPGTTFSISKSPITWEFYCKIMEIPCSPGLEKMIVNGITHSAATEFCKKLTKLSPYSRYFVPSLRQLEQGCVALVAEQMPGFRIIHKSDPLDTAPQNP